MPAQGNLVAIKQSARGSMNFGKSKISSNLA